MKILGFEIRWPRPKGCAYNPPYDNSNEIPRGPHCDSRIVHAPGIGCDFCDDMIDAQVYRIHHSINFTGERFGTRAICPAEELRSLEIINSWPGNRPLKKDRS